MHHMDELSFYKIYNYLSTIVQTEEEMQASFRKEKFPYMFLGE